MKKLNRMEALAWVNRAAWAIDEARKSLLGLNTEKTTIGRELEMPPADADDPRTMILFELKKAKKGRGK